MFILVIGLISCSNTRSRVEPEAIPNADTTSTSDTISNQYELAAIFRDLDSDSLLATGGTLSKINELLKRGIEIRQQEFGGGDCGGKFKELTSGKDTLTVVKYDCGDYGFGNTQFVTSGDSLKFVREYRMEWFSDSIGDQFIVNESIYHFAGSASTKRMRTKFIQKWKDFRMSNVDLEESPIAAHEEYDAFKKNLKNLPSLKIE